MATWQDIITAAQTLLQRWKRDVDFTSQIVNGPATGPTSVVNTDGGTIPTFAKTLADITGEGQSLRSDLANTSDTLKGDAMLGVKQPFAGAVARTQHDKNQEYVTPEDFGATGGSDDTAAFNAAFAASKTVACRPGRTYTIGDVAVPDNGTLDMRGAIIVRKVGANNALTMNSYRNAIRNGEIRGSAWKSTTIASITTAGNTVINVADATGIVAGMRVFFPSAWADGGIETNEIASVAVNAITLRKAIRGDVAVGANFLADFPVIRSSGSTYAGTFENVFIRNCLVGLQSGENSASGGNAFTNFDGVIIEDFIGAGLVIAGNIAAEDFGTFRLNSGKTSTSNYTGDGVTTTFEVPYLLAKKVYRWGSEPSIRLIINGVQQPVANYTVNTSAMTITVTSAPANGAAVQVQNYEYAAFGIVGQNISVTGPSSVERISNAIIVACNIGQFYDGCTLGFFTNLQSDTCGYCATLFYGSSDIHLRGTDHLFSPFGVIVNGDCSNMSLVGTSTGLIPDSSEFSITAGKTEIVVRSGATNINVDLLSWSSKNSYTKSIANGTLPSSSSLYASVLSQIGALPLAGGSMTGQFTVSYATPQMYLNTASAGQAASKFWQSGGTTVWEEQKSTSDNFVLKRYVGGVFQDNPVVVNNASGLVTFLQANSGQYQVGGTKVIGTQVTGYGTPTGNVKLANFPGATATLAQTSAQVAQLIIDLKAHGLLGA